MPRPLAQKAVRPHQVACALDDSTVRLVDLRLGRPGNTLQGHTKPPLSVAWGDEHLYSAGMAGLSTLQISV